MSNFPIHGWRTRGYVPHLDHAGSIQHVIFGLADSLPRETSSENEPDQINGFDSNLDRGLGDCLLRIDKCACAVQDELLRHDAVRYYLLAWCVMPNHVHVVIEQIGDLAGTVRRWKSWTAREINRALDRRGPVWLREYYDRFARNEKHAQTMIQYVEDNPVRAGFVAEAGDWPWSSAGYARIAGQAPGAP